MDTQGLAFALRQAIEGEVRFDDGSRHLYSTDASNFRQMPVGVVLPRTVEDIVATHRICRDHGAPITNRGGGTSLAGQACNAAVIIDTSKYLRDILEVDEEARTATVRPGIVLDTLRDEIRSLGLTWGPDPSTHNRCTVGGMIGNNACGMHAYAYGRTEDNVEELEVLLYDGTRMTVGRHDENEIDAIVTDGGRRGEIYERLRDLRDRYADEIRERYPDIPRRVSGYNLTELLAENGFHVARALVGTEGTCGTILSAKLKLNRYWPKRALLVLGFPSVFEAGDCVAEIRDRTSAIALEGMDRHLVRNMREKHLYEGAIEYLPEGDGWLLVEFGADTEDEAEAEARDLMAFLDERDVAPTMRLYEDDEEAEQVWHAREAGLGATAHFQGTDSWPGWEDSAVAPEDVGDYLRDLKDLFDEHGLDASVYGHFGDGCIHCRINFDLASPGGVKNYRNFMEAAADLVSEYNGSYSGEHGDGQQRGELLERMYGSEIVQAFREFKGIFDPDNKMNPGKVVDPYKLDEHLRLGPGHRQWRPETKFDYPRDGFDYNRAQLRCVGVGKCRRDDGHGTMCPSYMVTHEEMHSTRGRARLLFEMLQPDSELDGWRDESVKEALDLCLSCKGCKSDCPVDVDIATYKAEFLHHHYEGRPHPRTHYALGLINVWSRIASWVPGLANLTMQTRGVSWLMKKLAGVTTERPAPTFATKTFRKWFEQRGPRNQGAPRVILFPDTFSNYLEPQITKAGVEVLEDAGYRVEIPPQVVCCGRPLYDYGFLDLAERYLDTLLETFGPEVADGTKIVGVEPSCVAVFRGELMEMKPNDADARRISAATMTLGEFLVDEADYDFPQLSRRALLHGHCHQKGEMGMDGVTRALDAMGLDWEDLDAGCCGLAGSFGFEAGEKYEVSVAAGERKLLPAVRDADDDTLILADGFSCRTQITQLQDRRRPLHLAETILLALAEGPDGPARGSGPVERPFEEDESAGLTGRDAAVLAGVGLAGAAAAWALRR